jgi:hypothetical protein
MAYLRDKLSLVIPTRNQRFPPVRPLSASACHRLQRPRIVLNTFRQVNLDRPPISVYELVTKILINHIQKPTVYSHADCSTAHGATAYPPAPLARGGSAMHCVRSCCHPRRTFLRHPLLARRLPKTCKGRGCGVQAHHCCLLGIRSSLAVSRTRSHRVARSDSSRYGGCGGICLRRMCGNP